MVRARLRREREGTWQTRSPWIMPLLRRQSRGHGCRDPVEALFLAPVLQGQEKVFLHSLLQTFRALLLEDS